VTRLVDLMTVIPSSRAAASRILINSLRLDDFKRNPQQFIEAAAEAINRVKRLALVDCIKYERIGDQEYYCQELFEKEELTGHLKQSMETKPD
jgi:type III restriction enzyme